MVFYNLGHIIGEKGEKGDKGDKGNKGDKGDAGTITLDNNVAQDSSNAVKSSGIYSALTNKVDKVTGKGLSTNDYTTAEKSKLANIEAEANKTIIVDNLTTNDASKVLSAKQGKALKDYVDGLIGDIEEDMLQ